MTAPTLSPALVLPGVRRRRRLLAGLAAVLVMLSIAALGVGEVAIDPGATLAILADQIGIELPWHYDAVQAAVLLELRLPRLCMGVLVGAALGCAGAALQGLFRNPLADPALIGVSAGAGFAVAVAMVVGGALLASPLALAAVAMLGGLGAVTTVWRLATRHGRTSMATMLLAGIAINALASAGIGLCIYGANDAELRDISFWMLGSLGGARWSLVLAIMPFIAIAVLGLPRLARSLNAMVLGDEEAGHLGVEVDRVKRRIVAATALAVGAAVSVSGLIGFVGLIVPHTVRAGAGPDHRLLVPASALLGAIALVSADLLARTVAAPADLPIGIVTALVGSPVFLWILLRQPHVRGQPS